MASLRLTLASLLVTVGGALKVSVLGGSGFVGSRVCKSLVSKGADVTSLSKTGKVPEWASAEPWASSVQWVAVDLLSSGDAAIDAAMGSPEAVVSCVGAIGTDPDVLKTGNGACNVNGFASAKRAGVKRAVLVSVASEVAACQENWLPDFFSGYFDGKQMAEEAAADAAGGDATRVTLVKPTFIYGGDSFGLLPPRVSAAYGSGIEELLSIDLISKLADATPGLIKVSQRAEPRRQSNSTLKLKLNRLHHGTGLRAL